MEIEPCNILIVNCSQIGLFSVLDIANVASFQNHRGQKNNQNMNHFKERFGLIASLHMGIDEVH